MHGLLYDRNHLFHGKKPLPGLSQQSENQDSDGFFRIRNGQMPFPDPLPDQPFQLCLQKLIGILGDGVMGNDFQHAVQILFLIS